MSLNRRQFLKAAPSPCHISSLVVHARADCVEAAVAATELPKLGTTVVATRAITASTTPRDRIQVTPRDVDWALVGTFLGCECETPVSPLTPPGRGDHVAASGIDVSSVCVAVFSIGSTRSELT